MRPSFSRLAVLAPVMGLVLIGVASVAFSWGVNAGGSHATLASPAIPRPAARGSAAPGGAAPGAAAPGAAGPNRGNPGFGAAPGLAIGTVASKTNSAIIVTTVSGQTVTVNVSASTTYSSRGGAAATLASVVVGGRIVVQGTPNADGSINATHIQIGAGGRGFGGGFGRGSGGGPGLPTPVPSTGPVGPTT
jgi:hypothetical protein